MTSKTTSKIIWLDFFFFLSAVWVLVGVSFTKRHRKDAVKDADPAHLEKSRSWRLDFNWSLSHSVTLLCPPPHSGGEIDAFRGKERCMWVHVTREYCFRLHFVHSVILTCKSPHSLQLYNPHHTQCFPSGLSRWVMSACCSLFLPFLYIKGILSSVFIAV